MPQSRSPCRARKKGNGSALLRSSASCPPDRGSGMWRWGCRQVWESAEALEVSRQQRQASAQRRTRSGSSLSMNRSEPYPHAASTVISVWLPLVGHLNGASVLLDFFLDGVTSPQTYCWKRLRCGNLNS